ANRCLTATAYLVLCAEGGRKPASLIRLVSTTSGLDRRLMDQALPPNIGISPGSLLDRLSVLQHQPPGPIRFELFCSSKPHWMVGWFGLNFLKLRTSVVFLSDTSFITFP